MSIKFKTLAELKRLLENKEISSYELVNETFKNISSSKTNSFITLDEEAALNKAKDFDKGKVDGDLAGIPIAQKDLFCTKNLRTTCGSKILENFIPPYDATVVEISLLLAAFVLEKPIWMSLQWGPQMKQVITAVSYTHLTLPTKRIV